MLPPSRPPGRVVSCCCCCVSAAAGPPGSCGSGPRPTQGTGGLRTTTPGRPRGGPRSPSAGGFGRLRRWARARRSGGAAWLAVAEQPRARGPAAAHSEAVRLASRLADRLGAPQAPGAPTRSGGDANFRASGGVEAGTEVQLRPGPGRLLEEGGWSDGARRPRASEVGVRFAVGARRPRSLRWPAPVARAQRGALTSAEPVPSALQAAPESDCRSGAARP